MRIVLVVSSLFEHVDINKILPVSDRSREFDVVGVLSRLELDIFGQVMTVQDLAYKGPSNCVGQHDCAKDCSRALPRTP